MLKSNRKNQESKKTGKRDILDRYLLGNEELDATELEQVKGGMFSKCW